MNNEYNMTKVVSKIVDEFGENILLNKKKFINIFKDYAPNMKREAVMLSTALNLDIAKYFVGCVEDDRKANVTKAKNEMYGLLSDEYIRKILDTFIFAFKWNLENDLTNSTILNYNVKIQPIKQNNNVEIYDANGFDKDGFNKAGYDKDGYDRQGYSRRGFNRNGYDIYGYDRSGYDKNGYDCQGYDKNGYDKNGKDKYGCFKNGYNEEGYDSAGYDALGYDKNGYDKNGYDSLGFDKNGYDKNGYDASGYDKNGFNKNGYDEIGYDKNGFDINGIHKDTNAKYDKNGYDKNGYDKYNCTKLEYKTFKWYIAVLKENDDAKLINELNELGNLYYIGKNGCVRDFSKAVQCYKKAAIGGNTDAMNKLGDCYYWGNGVEKNYKEALKWYQQAASAGHNQAKNNIKLLMERNIY